MKLNNRRSLESDGYDRNLRVNVHPVGKERIPMAIFEPGEANGNGKIWIDHCVYYRP
jgi:hypothetical protein